MSSRVLAVFALLLCCAFARADDSLYPRPVVLGLAPWEIGTVTPLDANGDGRKDVVVSRLADGAFPALVLLPAVGTELSFGDSIPMTLGVHPASPVAGDFDGDGDEDYATLAAPTQPRLYVVRSNGDGSFAVPLAIDLPHGPTRAEPGDVDGDGDLDVLLLDWGVFVARNDGGGAFTPGPLTLAAPGAEALGAGDVDGDGVLDAVIGKDAEVVVGEGDGALSYTTLTTLAAPDGALSVAVGHLDTDGFADIAWCSPTIAGSRVCHGAGSGAFAAPVAIPGPVGTGLEEVGLADLDGDGDSDLALRSGKASKRFVYVAYADGGTVAIPPTGLLELESGLCDFALGDLDADGLTDIVASSSGTDVLVVRGSGTPGFAQGTPFTGVTDFFTGVYATADFAADGCEDILYGGPGEPLRVLRGSPAGFGSIVLSADPAPSATWVLLAAGDFDGDGQADAVGANQQSGPGNVGLRLVRGQGDGTLVTGPLTSFSGALIAAAVPSDLDLDGDLDLWGCRQLQAVECLNGGTGVFTTVTAAATGPLGAVDVGDVNGDGLPDAICSVVFPFPGGMDLRLNLGGGVLGPKQYHAVGGASRRLADVDGDGLADLVQGRMQTGGIDDIEVRHWLPGGGFGALTSLKSGFVTGTTPQIGGVEDITGDGLADVVAFSYGRLAVAVADALHPLHAAGVHLTWTGNSQTLDLNGDGTTDVVTMITSASGVSAYFSPCLPSPAAGPWTNLGFALAGIAGPPTLTGTGTLEGGTQVAVDLAGAKPSEPAAFFASGSTILLPWKGGTLVPSPDVIGPFVTDNSGAVHLQMTWPSGIPANVDLYLQVWIKDAAGAKGYASSNGLRALTP